MANKSNVTDLISGTDILVWLGLSCIFPPWFFIHPILVLIVAHKRANND